MRSVFIFSSLLKFTIECDSDQINLKTNNFPIPQKHEENLNY